MPVAQLFGSQTVIAGGAAQRLVFVVLRPEIEHASYRDVVDLTAVSYCLLRSALPCADFADEMGEIMPRPPWLAGASSFDQFVLAKWHPDPER